MAADAYSKQAIDVLCARLPLVAHLYERRRVEGAPNPMDYQVVGTKRKNLRYAWALSRIAGGSGPGTSKEATADEIAAHLKTWPMPHVVAGQLMDGDIGTQVIFEGITTTEHREYVAGFVALLNVFDMPASLRWTPARVIRAWSCAVSRSELRDWLRDTPGGAEIVPFVPRGRIKGAHQ